MALPQDWVDMAKDSLKSANRLLDVEDDGYTRSATSRAYYSAYQASTSLLHAAGNTAPTIYGTQREGWNHKQTPDKLLDSLGKLPVSKDNRRKMRSTLGMLYKLRCQADYISTQEITATQSKKAKREAGFILKVAQSAIQ